jgi:hypothetical protein
LSNEDPTAKRFKATLKKEFAMMIHRGKERLAPGMKAWLQSLDKWLLCIFFYLLFSFSSVVDKPFYFY